MIALLAERLSYVPVEALSEGEVYCFDHQWSERRHDVEVVDEEVVPVEVVELLQGQIPQGHRTNVRVSKRASSVGSW